MAERTVASPYDEMPYAKTPFAQSHPDRLAVLGTLFGMAPTPVERCKVLELGCAQGGNLLPMACAFPGSRFLGIELSKRQVTEGSAVIKTLRIKNADIRQVDLAEVTKKLGIFDYIIAHGVFSWVPSPVQEKLLKICRDNLAPNGIAYISFNAFPGWHFRRMIRDMMLYHVRGLSEPKEQVAQARGLLDFLADSVPQDNTYGRLLKDEAELLRKQADSYLFHDHLEEANEPLYFHEFVSRAERHKLQYLAEADISTMMVGHFPARVVETLRRISNDVVRTEQYLDFLRNRSFRQTLLCRKEVALSRNLAPQNIIRLRIASAAKARSPQVDINSAHAETFQAPNGVTFATSIPLVKAALVHLGEIWPHSLPFNTLVTTARARIDSPPAGQGESLSPDIQALAAQLLEGYTNNFVALRSQEPPFVTTISEYPCVSPLARHQAAAGDPVTNQLHESGVVSDLVRQILQLLDGRNNRGAIAERLAKLIEEGKLANPFGQADIPRGEVLRSHLGRMVDDNLAQFARLALLIS